MKRLNINGRRVKKDKLVKKFSNKITGVINKSRVKSYIGYRNAMSAIEINDDKILVDNPALYSKKEEKEKIRQIAEIILDYMLKNEIKSVEVWYNFDMFKVSLDINSF